MRQYRIAHAAGIPASTLSQICTGARPVEPGDERVLAVAEVLGMKPEECFVEEK